MLWGIDRSEWIQLWSGGVGAFVAALIGGGVALLVVRLTASQHESEASKGRQIEAIWELLVALDEMVRIVSGTAAQRDLAPSVSRLQDASARLQMELRKGSMRTELRRSTIFFHRFADDVSESSSFVDAAGVFRFEIMQWPSASKKQKGEIAQKLIDMRAGYEDQWRASSVNTSFSGPRTTPEQECASPHER